jgi:hypothetical protein
MRVSGPGPCARPAGRADWAGRTGCALAVLVSLSMPPGGTHAQVFRHASFGWQVRTPPGWELRGPGSANPVVFVSRAPQIQLRIQATRRPVPLSEPLARETRLADEQALRARFPASKSVAVGGPALAGRPTTHYGWAYRDARGTVLVARFALASVSQGTRHLWIKTQAVFAREETRPATSRLDALLENVTVPGEAGAGTPGDSGPSPGPAPAASARPSPGPPPGMRGWMSIYEPPPPGAAARSRFLDGFKTKTR